MVCCTFGLLPGSKMGPLLTDVFSEDSFFKLKDIDIAILPDYNALFISSENIDSVIKSLV